MVDRSRQSRILLVYVLVFVACTMILSALLPLLPAAATLFSPIRAAPSPSQSFQSQCESFQPQKHVYNSTLDVLEYVTAGTNVTFPDDVISCNRSSQVVAVDLCRVALSIPTSNRSSISFEAWFPANWTGRFLATGNGGVDGCK